MVGRTRRLSFFLCFIRRLCVAAHNRLQLLKILFFSNFCELNLH